MTVLSENEINQSDLERVARWLTHPKTSMGHLAALRRMTPEEPSRAAVVLYQLLSDLSISSAQVPAWALIVHCLALAHGKHRCGGPSVGQVLFALQYGEARLELLLRADAGTLGDVLPRLARRLHSGGQWMDWWPLVQLVLHVQQGSFKAQHARAQIARDYVLASKKDRANQTSKE